MAETIGTSNLLIDNSSAQGQVVGILMYITPKVAQTLGGMHSRNWRKINEYTGGVSADKGYFDDAT